MNQAAMSEKTKEVRTRFAPSPTGFLHVGSVRTTILAWALARHYNGKFLLRIEDTDQARLVPGAIKALLEDLEWIGITIDEGPSTEDILKVDPTCAGIKGIGGPYGSYVQSQRLPRYKEIADKLVASGHAYRCDCTSEMLEQERKDQMARRELPGYTGYCRHRNVGADTKHVVRLKIPQKVSVSLDDGIRGNITWDSPSLRDTVLLKSDGFPTYHLAVVVDDHDMKITHVTRGEEWISSTPIHILIYQALGWEMPIICHFPNVMGNDGKKLSKRHGATFVSGFREAGYLPEALFNFLALIGWSPGKGEEQEIFTKQEIVERFSLEHVNSAGGIFAYDKLDWMNGQYIRALPLDEFLNRVRPFVVAAGLKINEERFRAIAPHIQERMVKLTDAAPLIDFLFVEKLDRQIPEMFKKGIDQAKAIEILEASLTVIEALPSFDITSLDAALRPLADKFGIKVGPMFGVIRIAVTGKSVTPPLFESLHALGKVDTVARTRETIGILKGAGAALGAVAG